MYFCFFEEKTSYEMRSIDWSSNVCSSDPQATSLHRFDLATLTHTCSGRVDGYLLNEFALSAHEGHLRVAVTLGGGRMGIPMPIEPGIGDSSSAAESDAVTREADLSVEQPLNEVVVLDTDGDLDVVGRTARSGLTDATLHGTRFVGDPASPVPFLQPDPSTSLK